MEKYHELFDIIAEFDVAGHVKVNKAGETVQENEDGVGGSKMDEVDAWTDLLLARPYRRRIMPVYHPMRVQNGVPMGHSIKWLQSWLVDVRSPLIGWSSATVQNPSATIALCHRYWEVHSRVWDKRGSKTDAQYT